MSAAHCYRIRVRYEETDRMGVVYHANHLRYFETGRTELMREKGITYRHLEESGTLLAVTEAQVRFRGRVTYDDEIVVETRLSMEGRTVFRFDYRVFGADDERLVSEGYTRHVCINPDGRPVRPPAHLVDAIRTRVEGKA